MREKAERSWEEKALNSFDALCNDDVKVHAAEVVSHNLRQIQKTLKTKKVPKGAVLPSLQDWLQENDLADLYPQISGWKLKTLLNTCLLPVFETDHADLAAPDRRDLYDALCETLDDLQPPPTPSPKKLPPRKRERSPSGPSSSCPPSSAPRSAASSRRRPCSSYEPSVDGAEDEPAGAADDRTSTAFGWARHSDAGGTEFVGDDEEGADTTEATAAQNMLDLGMIPANGRRDPRAAAARQRRS